MLYPTFFQGGMHPPFAQDLRPCCLSVCPSHAGIETAKHVIKVFFSPSGSQTILVFPYQSGWQYSDEDPLTGASNARGYEKITILDQYLALSRK